LQRFSDAREDWFPNIELKHQVVHLLQKYVLNPPIELFFALGVAPPGYALLETIGRNTGKPRRTPVGNGLVGEQFWIVAEHGRKSGYVRNIASNPRVRVKFHVGFRARRYPGTASLLSDDDPRERQRWLCRQVRSSVMNSAAVRFFGTQLLTVRIDLDSE
jgi:deazaflavin-dependent oxidoreductase (nitroreductase family)